jgi:hypothetical protein
MTLPDPIAALVEFVLEPFRLGKLFVCRACGRITTTRETWLTDHRDGCPLPSVREYMRS